MDELIFKRVFFTFPASLSRLSAIVPKPGTISGFCTERILYRTVSRVVYQHYRPAHQQRYCRCHSIGFHFATLLLRIPRCAKIAGTVEPVTCLFLEIGLLPTQFNTCWSSIQCLDVHYILVVGGFYFIYFFNRSEIPITSSLDVLLLG